MAPPPTVFAVIGPTAVGKTAFAIELARALRERGEDPVAVSADALQLYRGVERLTGAATDQERAMLEHRLLGVLGVTERASAGQYAALAHAEIDGLLAAGRRPIVVGGTGLYLRAALTDLQLRPPVDPAIRARVRAELERHGAAMLHSRLAARNSSVAAAIAPTDPQRITRALELIEAGHAPPPADAAELWTAHARHPTRLLGLVRDRAQLHELIDARVDAIVAAGAAGEVRAADAAGASDAVRGAVGFAELLAGDVEAMRTRTRRYARRQLTWMRKTGGIELIDLTHRTIPQAVAAVLQD